MTSEPGRVNVLGVGISGIDMDEALQTIEGWIERREPHYACLCTVHTVMECRLSGQTHMERVYGPDLMLALCEQSVRKGYRHYFYGGAEGVPERLAELLQGRFPGLQVAGAYSPPFGPLTKKEDAAILDRINESDPDIVWVGLGTPKQDWCVGTHVRRVRAPALIPDGAGFDFLTGRKPQAPRWVQPADPRTEEALEAASSVQPGFRLAGPPTVVGGCAVMCWSDDWPVSAVLVGGAVECCGPWGRGIGWAGREGLEGRRCRR